MKKTFFIANWKEHKNTEEAISWFSQMAANRSELEHKDIIVCPSFTLLPIVKDEIERLHLPIQIGAQDFPAFDEGAYTGEESPELLKEYVQYAIIGHSERRNLFAESDERISQKVTLARKYGIEPILCVQNMNTPIPKGVSLVAYEPVFAIGTGTPDTPENAAAVSEGLQKTLEHGSVLYGGSVTGDNVSSFLQKGAINGVLVGSASLDPTSFIQIIKNA